MMDVYLLEGGLSHRHKRRTQVVTKQPHNYNNSQDIVISMFFFSFFFIKN